MNIKAGLIMGFFLEKNSSPTFRPLPYTVKFNHWLENFLSRIWSQRIVRNKSTWNCFTEQEIVCCGEW